MKRNSQPLRVLMICKSLPDTFKGGIQTHTMSIVKELSKYGVEVTVLAGGSFWRKIRFQHLNGVRVIRIPYFPGRRLPFLGALAEQFSFGWTVNRWLKKHATEFDIIHLQGRSGAYRIETIAQRVPVVATFHGITELEMPENLSLAEELLLRFIQKLERETCRVAHGLLFVSSFAKHTIFARYPVNSRVNPIIPNGVATFHPSGRVIKRNKLVFVGRLCGIKGVDTLIDIFPTLPESIELHVIGDGPEMQNLRKQACKIGLEGRIIFHGQQPMSMVQEHIEEAFALVLPSFVETQGLVLLEANMLGRPVICRDIPGTQDVVQHEYNGLRFRSTSEMAGQINRLYYDPDLGDKLGRRGRQLVSTHYNWEHITEKTINVYQQCIAKFEDQHSSMATIPVLAQIHPSL